MTQSSSAMPLLILAGIAILALLLLLIVQAFRARRAGRPTLDGIAARLAQLEQVSRQVQDLSNLFLVPGARGPVGETLLSRLLEDWLPAGAYELQYAFSNGARADAVVKLTGTIIAIDAKFPLEATRRAFEQHDTPPESLPADVRRAFSRHITDISAKYIRPEDGTMNFALMYIPSEAVYHFVFVEHPEETLRESLERGVVPVSPGTLFLYLQTVAFGLKGLSLPETQRALLAEIQRLRRDFEELKRGLQLAGTHFRNLGKALEETGSKASRVDADIERLDGA